MSPVADTHPGDLTTRASPGAQGPVPGRAPTAPPPPTSRPGNAHGTFARNRPRPLTTSPSFVLRTFGGLAALRADGRPAEGAGSQKRRLALLALIDAAGERGISRDKLIGLLWPESDMEKARGALAQALYALKKGLGHEDLFTGTNEIHLNPECLTSDRSAFLSAIAAGDRERAVAQYAGPYLDGFYLSEAPEFERWVESERASLAHDYVAALQHLAARAEANRDPSAAVGWWRKLVAVDPLNGTLTAGLIRALADSGDRAGALRQAQIYQTLVEEEFGAPGDPAVAALVEELRRPASVPAPVFPKRTLAEQLSTSEVVATAMKRLRTSRVLAPAAEALAVDAAPTPERRRLSAVQESLSTAGYLIEKEIGTGGMATVYLARDVRHDRDVAIKILHEGLGSSVGTERFLAEIKTTARLQHPHILPLLDSGSVGDAAKPGALLFYVMPFFRGETLRDRLSREKQLPIDEVVRLTVEIADALGYAHEQGIVHRDIKPENILLQRGHALVADFGIALAVQTAGGERLTRKGLSLGTPEYMAPEQASASAQVDQRADIYALGAVAYEMLTGDPPFTGSTMHAIVAKIMNERPVPPRTVRDTVPPGVEAAVLTALAKLPADRFSQASDFTRALAELPLTTSGARPGTPPPTRTRWRMVLGFGAAGLALATLATFVLLRREPAPLVLGAVKQVTRTPDTLNFDAAISPDGNMVAYAAGPAGQMRLFVRQVAGSAPVPVATGLVGDHRWPRWSPDGQRLAFTANKAIYVVPALGGSSQLIMNLGDAVGQPAWSPDGTQLAYADSNGIAIVAATGGSPQRVVHALEAHAPSWSPDGQRISYAVENLSFLHSANYGNAAPSSIWTASASGGDSVLVAEARHQNTSPMWWPDGRSILFVSDRDGTRDVYRQRVDRNGRPKGNPVRVTSGLAVHSLTLSRDGSQMAYSTLQLRRNIWMAPIKPGQLTPASAAHPVTTEKQAIEGLAISHDGKWLAYDTNRDGNLNIYKIAFNGTATEGEPIALTRDPSNDYQPRWSPNDAEVVFYSPRFGTRDVFTVNADGRHEARVTDRQGNEYYPDWSPDGRRVVFSSQVTYSWDAFTVDRGTGAAWSSPTRIDVAGQVGVNARWSPDGRTIAMVSAANLVLVPVDGGAVRPIVDHGALGESITFVAWGRDASQVYFGTRDSTMAFSFWAVPTVGGPPRRVLRLADPGRRPRRPEFDTDGKNLFFTIANDEADVAVVSLKRP